MLGVRNLLEGAGNFGFDQSAMGEVVDSHFPVALGTRALKRSVEKGLDLGKAAGGGQPPVRASHWDLLCRTRDTELSSRAGGSLEGSSRGGDTLALQ